jgi:hypothetical protein
MTGRSRWLTSDKHPNLIAFYEYTSEMDTQLKELNSAIRFIAETKDQVATRRR